MKSSNIYQQWNLGGGRDWRPLLRGILGQNFIRKHEILSRNAFLLSPKEYWTFANGRADFSKIASTDTFQIDVVDEWNLRLGNTGSPVVPGDSASAKLAIMPPGVKYDFLKSIANASNNRAAMWRDANIYNGNGLKFEIGGLEGVRFQEVPNDRYGQNLATLYNAGFIFAQYGVTAPIRMGDGAPDPEDNSVKMDEVWSVGQKNVTHYIQLQSDADMSKFSKHDLVTVHLHRTNYFGVTNGVDFRNGKSIVRKIIAIDTTNKRLAFDRPILFNFDTPFTATPQGDLGATTEASPTYTHQTAGSYYAFVTKARHVGMILVLGSRGGVMGKIDKPVEFYEPKPVDDFESVWRVVWDEYAGISLWEPNLFEVHFCAVSLAKPGGVLKY